MRAARSAAGGRRSGRTGRPKLSREDVLDRVMARIDRFELATPEVDELYASAGVSPRTLRTVFRDVFGMTPGRYLRFRRLCQLYVALLMADPGSRTVGEICSRFRITDAGRMARDYRAAFGEYPRQTLARRPGPGALRRAAPRTAAR